MRRIPFLPTDVGKVSFQHESKKSLLSHERGKLGSGNSPLIPIHFRWKGKFLPPPLCGLRRGLLCGILYIILCKKQQKMMAIRVELGEGGDYNNTTLTGCVAQLVRAPDCGSGGRGFESRRTPHFYSFKPSNFQKSKGWTSRGILILLYLSNICNADV